MNGRRSERSPWSRSKSRAEELRRTTRWTGKNHRCNQLLDSFQKGTLTIAINQHSQPSPLIQEHRKTWLESMKENKEIIITWNNWRVFETSHTAQLIKLIRMRRMVRQVRQLTRPSTRNERRPSSPSSTWPVMTWAPLCQHASEWWPLGDRWLILNTLFRYGDRGNRWCVDDASVPCSQPQVSHRVSWWLYSILPACGSLEAWFHREPVGSQLDACKTCARKGRRSGRSGSGFVQGAVKHKKRTIGPMAREQRCQTLWFVSLSGAFPSFRSFQMPPLCHNIINIPIDLSVCFF